MKQTDFAERLTQALDLRGLSAADLSRATGVSDGTISCYKKGKYQAKQNRVYDFARVLRVDPAWLMGYDVPMEPQKQAAPQPTPIPPGFQPMPTMGTVAIVGRIACGTPILAEQNIEGSACVPARWRATFSLVCKGDSMEPKIHDGDLVAIRKQPKVENGEIAAVRIGAVIPRGRLAGHRRPRFHQRDGAAHLPLFFDGMAAQIHPAHRAAAQLGPQPAPHLRQPAAGRAYSAGGGRPQPGPRPGQHHRQHLSLPGTGILFYIFSVFILTLYKLYGII